MWSQLASVCICLLATLQKPDQQISVKSDLFFIFHDVSCFGILFHAPKARYWWILGCHIHATDLPMHSKYIPSISRPGWRSLTDWCLSSSGIKPSNNMKYQYNQFKTWYNKPVHILLPLSPYFVAPEVPLSGIHFQNSLWSSRALLAP